MRKIYTGIDFGSDSIKVVVCEYYNEKFHVLASSSVKSSGIKKGLVFDVDSCAKALKNAIDKIEETIGVKVTEAITTVPSNNRLISIVQGESNIQDEVVSGNDILDCINTAAQDQVDPGFQEVCIIPIYFGVDDEEQIKNPRGKKGEILSVKALLATVPIDNVKPIYDVCSRCGIEIKDIAFGSIGDYYEARSKETDSSLGAIINVGYNTINVSIFNKGIIIKNQIINLGSKNIDKDITYMYGTSLEVSKNLKEKYAVCSRRYADMNDTIEIDLGDDNNQENNKVSISQYELTEVVEARVSELLKLAKNQIIYLTKRKISYIIVTGGISELAGFGYVVENVLGINASTLNMTDLGVRSNMFSSCTGIIKYFHEKSNLLGIDYTMFDEEILNELMNNNKNLLNATNDNLVSKVVNIFTGK